MDKLTWRLVPAPCPPICLQSLAADLRGTQLKLADAEGRLQQREEDLQAAAAEVRGRRAARFAGTDSFKTPFSLPARPVPARILLATSSCPTPPPLSAQPLS